MCELPHGWRGEGRAKRAAAALLGRESVEVQVKYAKYLERQEKEVARMQSSGAARIPDGFDFASLPCLSTEEVEKLTMERPQTLEAAGNIPGITPKALLYLYNELQATQRKNRRGQSRHRLPGGRGPRLAGRAGHRGRWRGPASGKDLAGRVIES